MARSWARCVGRSRCDTSWNAWNASSLSASGLMRRMVWLSHVVVLTPSMASLRQGVPVSFSGNIGE